MPWKSMQLKQKENKSFKESASPKKKRRSILKKDNAFDVENKDISVAIVQTKSDLASKTKRRTKARLGKQKSKKLPQKMRKAITKRMTLVMKHRLLNTPKTKLSLLQSKRCQSKIKKQSLTI